MEKEFIPISNIPEKTPADDSAEKIPAEIEGQAENPISETDIAETMKDERDQLDSVELPKDPEQREKASLLMKKFKKLMGYLMIAASIQGAAMATNIEKAEAGDYFTKSIERDLGRNLGRGIGRGAGRAVEGIFDALGNRVIRGIGKDGDTPREEALRRNMEIKEQMRERREMRSYALRMQAEQIRAQMQAERELSRIIMNAKNPEEKLELEIKMRLLNSGKPVVINGTLYNAPPRSR